MLTLGVAILVGADMTQPAEPGIGSGACLRAAGGSGEFKARDVSTISPFH